MNRERLTNFSDCAIAIIITIMVLELQVPHGATLEALAPMLPVFLSYVLSFVFVAIYTSRQMTDSHPTRHPRSSRGMTLRRAGMGQSFGGGITGTTTTTCCTPAGG